MFLVGLTSFTDRAFLQIRNLADDAYHTKILGTKDLDDEWNCLFFAVAGDQIAFNRLKPVLVSQVW